MIIGLENQFSVFFLEWLFYTGFTVQADLRQFLTLCMLDDFLLICCLRIFSTLFFFSKTFFRNANCMSNSRRGGLNIMKGFSTLSLSRTLITCPGRTAVRRPAYPNHYRHGEVGQSCMSIRHRARVMLCRDKGNYRGLKERTVDGLIRQVVSIDDSSLTLSQEEVLQM